MSDAKDTRKIPEDKETVVSVSEPAAPLDVPLIPAPGVVVDGWFEIVSLLGKGGMCTVYKARHLLMDCPVALKMLHEKLVIDKNAMERFQREAKAISALEHPNIVKVYGFGAFGKVPFMAMEYLECVSLADLLKQEQRLSKERALPIFSQILDALAHAHERGIIHRDLKPSNVMLVGLEYQVKLVDFGIAKILPESGKELQKLTQTGDIFGTVPYMSPEQCSGAPLDTRSDLYSMGCLMYEVLDGKPPLQGDAPQITIIKHLYESPRASHYLADDFGAVVLAALGKDPTQRPQSAIELKSALSNPASFARRHISNKRKSNAIRVTSIALVLCIILICAGLFYLRHNHQEHSVKEVSSFKQAQQDRAEQKYRRVLERYEKAFGPDDPKILDHLYYLARSYQDQGKWAEAERLYERSLAIREKALGPNHSDVALSLDWLADCCLRQRKWAEAERLYKRSLAIREKALGPNHSDVALSLDALAHEKSRARAFNVAGKQGS